MFKYEKHQVCCPCYQWLELKFYLCAVNWNSLLISSNWDDFYSSHHVPQCLMQFTRICVLNITVYNCSLQFSLGLCAMMVKYARSMSCTRRVVKYVNFIMFFNLFCKSIMQKLYDYYTSQKKFDWIWLSKLDPKYYKWLHKRNIFSLNIISYW